MRAAVLEQVGAPLVVHDDVVAEEPHVGSLVRARPVEPVRQQRRVDDQHPSRRRHPPLARRGGGVSRGGVAAFAETVVIQETGAVKVPDDVALDVACVIGLDRTRWAEVLVGLGPGAGLGGGP